MLARGLLRARGGCFYAPARGMKIYTRTGDQGSTSLFNGERRLKSEATFEALGHADELSAAIGLAAAHCDQLGPNAAELQSSLLPQLSVVQSRLLDVGSAIATPLERSSPAQLERARYATADEDTAALEQWIDTMDERLPPLKSFILPGGGTVGASLHLARAICRRTERAVVPIVDAGECERGVAVYLNRLSDYLFTAARFAALVTRCEERAYQKARPPRAPRDSAGQS